jgi:hypothetical protein
MQKTAIYLAGFRISNCICLTHCRSCSDNSAPSTATSPSTLYLIRTCTLHRRCVLSCSCISQSHSLEQQATTGNNRQQQTREQRRTLGSSTRAAGTTTAMPQSGNNSSSDSGTHALHWPWRRHGHEPNDNTRHRQRNTNHHRDTHRPQPHNNYTQVPAAEYSLEDQAIIANLAALGIPIPPPPPQRLPTPPPPPVAHGALQPPPSTLHVPASRVRPVAPSVPGAAAFRPLPLPPTIAQSLIAELMADPSLKISAQEAKSLMDYVAARAVTQETAKAARAEQRRLFKVWEAQARRAAERQIAEQYQSSSERKRLKTQKHKHPTPPA